MLRSLYSGISGLRAHQAMLDVTGNNIANVNTAGFKASSTQFQDTLSQMTQGAGARKPRPVAPTPPRSASGYAWRESAPTSARVHRRTPGGPLT
ncbi:flagellar hook protein FlgE [Arthrobacter sp. Hiyo8]|nr:flagellar hook protein FlgE [Arthrobacter sp. Hiyo8]